MVWLIHSRPENRERLRSWAQGQACGQIALSKDAVLLARRHENAVLHLQVRRVRYHPVDRLWLAALI